MTTIKKANACYSGGGIYIVTGQLEDGNWILTSTDSDWYGDVLIVNADPEEDLDAATFPEWQDAHLVRETEIEEGIKLTRMAMDWILANKPEGNYIDSDIEALIAYFNPKETAFDQLVIDYDEFENNYDPYGYGDAFSSRYEGRMAVREGLDDADFRQTIIDRLQSIAEEDDEYKEKALVLIERIKALEN